MTSSLFINTLTELNYTVSQKQTIRSPFDHYFGKCRQIYKILSLSDSWRNIVYKHHKDSPRHLKHVSTLPCET